MKVRIETTVDVDTEVHVSVDDVIDEMLERTSDVEPEGWRHCARVLGPCTQILAAVPDFVLDKVPLDGLEELNKRLDTERHRVMRALNRKRKEGQ